MGTRPGDPFADVVFGYMFARILKTVEEQMQTAGIVERFEGSATHSLFPQETETFQIPYLGPTWMDDLCITLSAPTAHAIESKAGVACGILLYRCMPSTRRYSQLAEGQEGNPLCFPRTGTRALRYKYFGPHASGRMHVLTENGNREIAVVGHYQHLGGLVHHSGETRAEMRRRVAQEGHTTFTQHRKALFQNPQIPCGVWHRVLDADGQGQQALLSQMMSS